MQQGPRSIYKDRARGQRTTMPTKVMAMTAKHSLKPKPSEKTSQKTTPKVQRSHILSKPPVFNPIHPRLRTETLRWVLDAAVPLALSKGGTVLVQKAFDVADRRHLSRVADRNEKAAVL